MKNKKSIIVICIVALVIVIILYFLLFSNKEYIVEVALLDGKNNPSRKLVIKNGNKEVTDAREIKTIDGKTIDKSYPFTINHSSVKKVKDYIIVVLKNGKEVKAKIISKGE